MTWKEFKAAVEAQGLGDDTEVRWIDVGSGSDITVEVDEDGEATICG